MYFRKNQFGDVAGFSLLRPPDGPPFYIAVNKATNGLFKVFLQEKGGDMKEWDGDPNLPALNMTRAQAEACAEWVSGTLPTPEQLDFAAGYDDHPAGQEGPAAGRNGIAIGLREPSMPGTSPPGPLPVTRPHEDVSPRGIRDLSGNGREWTNKDLRGEKEVFAVLRGRMYTLSKPLTYEQMKRERDPNYTQTQRPEVASPQTGFRIVIPVK
jgi:formylglycine-generating enzyme required for sulfatase activity